MASWERKQKENWKFKAKYYIKSFGESTSLHGIRYIFNDKLHLSERLFWLLIVVLSAYVAGSLILNNWKRYNANPVVISLEKNFREWTILFPAATVCFQDKLNDTLATNYITERWNVKINTTEYFKYRSFLSSVVNLNYGNMHEFTQYVNDSGLTSIKGEEMAKIARQVMMKIQFHATLFTSAFKNLTFVETLTEVGICFTYSGLITNYISLIRNPRVNTTSVPRCNYLNSLCYARIEDLPAPIRYYVHSPAEIPEVLEKYFTVDKNMERDTSFKFLQSVASNDLRRLDPNQRSCRFVDEPVGKSKVYSHRLCKMGCRKRLAFDYCGCAPYFYLKEEGIPVCDVNGLACLSKHIPSIMHYLKTNGDKSACDCLVLCQITDYYLDRDSHRKWEYPVPPNIRFRWAVEHYSKTRQKRDIIFGFEDLLVSLGGTAALFLGCSVISFVEIVYFFTLRLFWFIIKKY